MSQLIGLADLHMHTTASDGRASVAQVLDYVAAQQRLDVIAITDHDTLDASLWAYEQRNFYPFDIVPGVEISSREGHVLGLWVMQPVPRDLSLAETAAAIHEQGGLAVLAHPCEMTVHPRASLRYLYRPEVLLKAGIDALEVHNSAIPTPGANNLARRIAAILKCPVTGGSDAHTLTGIGCGVTRFAGRTAHDLRQALVTGATMAEGVPWPIIDYWTTLTATTRRKLSVSSGTSMFYSRLIPR